MNKQNEEFHVEVIDVVENEDGSATVVLDMDSKAAQAFLSLGVLRAIEVGLEATESSEEEQ
jgi:hypothetical protein